MQVLQKTTECGLFGFFGYELLFDQRNDKFQKNSKPAKKEPEK